MQRSGANRKKKKKTKGPGANRHNVKGPGAQSGTMSKGPGAQSGKK
ncbi:hypothetical protein HYE19_03800 [Mycoplasmopsis bovis]|nr:hypothetical protein [Mycoplasmopsis bovis]QQH24921.1 hypothetical protein HYE19_03800 [Mycoplasmopsis bovis]